MIGKCLAALGAVLVMGVCGVCTADPVRKSVREGRLEDLGIARTGYVMKSRAFTPANRARALALVAALERRPPVSEARFQLDMMRLAALARNGHDSVDFEPDAWGPEGRTPFRMIWFPDGLAVARAAPEAADLLGAQVLAVEGLTPGRLLARLRAYCGGVDAYVIWNAEWLIENQGMLHLMGIAPQADSLRMTFRLRDGRTVTRRIRFIPNARAAGGGGPVGGWSPSPVRDEESKGWRAAAPRTPPLYLADMDSLFRMRDLPEISALYVQFRANLDRGDQRIAPFVKSVTDRLAAAPPANLVLDLRFDTGGDADQTRELTRKIAASVKGRIYLLVGRYTFSAGIVTAAAMKHDAAGRVIVVGEEPGDRLRWWSEIDETCLPNSHLCLHGTHGLWDLTRGCAAESGCYGDHYDARVDDLAPDIPAPLTARAWLSGRDPALDAIAARERAAR